jgi:hypothetical protein
LKKILSAALFFVKKTMALNFNSIPLKKISNFREFGFFRKYAIDHSATLYFKTKATTIASVLLARAKKHSTPLLFFHELFHSVLFPAENNPKNLSCLKLKCDCMKNQPKSVTKKSLK